MYITPLLDFYALTTLLTNVILINVMFTAVCVCVLSLESLQWLVVHGQGDALQPAADGMAPVHAAAQAGQLDCLRWLVEVACVSPRLKSGDGATPVHFAAASGKVSPSTQHTRVGRYLNLLLWGHWKRSYRTMLEYGILCLAYFTLINGSGCTSEVSVHLKNAVSMYGVDIHK